MDDEQYLKKLEIVLKAAQDEYKQITYDRRVIQHGLLKNYIWLATTLFSAQMAFMLYATGQQSALLVLEPGTWFSVFILLAIVLSCAVFCYGVDTVRGRGVTQPPYLMHYADMRDYVRRERFELGRPDNEGPIQPQDLYNFMIGDLQLAIEQNTATAETIGIKLRRLSYLLLGSIASTVAAFFVAVL